MTEGATHGAEGRRDGVLVVGQGAPARGGIPSFIASLLASEHLGARVRFTFLNTTRTPTRPGAVSLVNLRRGSEDLVRVYRGARRARIVHLHLAPAPLLPLVRAGALVAAARLGGAKVIVHAHSGRIHLAARSAAYRAGLWGLVRLAHHIVVVSADGEAAVRAAGGHPVLLENAIDTAAFPSPTRIEGVPVVAFVGTVCERKGLEDLRRALLIVRAQEPTRAFEVVIVGDGRQEGPGVFERVRASYAATGLEAVTFTGALEPDGVRAVLARADIFCLPSHWEGSPISVLEAMAAGCAVLASRVGDIPGVLDGGDAGVLVPPRSPEHLADALDALLADPAGCARLGQVARRRVRDRYDLSRLERRLIEIYSELSYSR